MLPAMHAHRELLGTALPSRIDRPLLLSQYREHVAALTRRASEALVAEGLDAMAIHSGSLIKRSELDDQFWPLRTVPHFQHWGHLEWPECVLHVAVGAKPRLLFVRDKSFWERPREPDWELLGAGLELVEATSPLGIKEQLARSGGRTAFVGENTKRATDYGIAAEHVCPKGLLERLDELRVHKSSYEITCLVEANRVASLGHEAVKEAFLGGERRELELHLRFLSATAQDDAETPYKNIVAIGESAAILHHVHYRRVPVAGGSLLLDAGATFLGYNSDITRTYVTADGRPGAREFGDLIQRMESLQQALVGGVKLGRPYETLHDEAHERLGRVLSESGIVRMSPEDCVASGVSRKFLPHGLGHSLGLQTHDVGCAKVRPRQENLWLRNTRVIEAGQVFTIEPGLYFIDTFMDELRAGPHAGSIDWARVEALAPFGGIRIEDDVVVLPDASVTTSRNLTREVL